MANLEFIIYQIKVDGTMNLITRLSPQHQESYEPIRSIMYFSQEEDESIEIDDKAMNFLNINLRTKFVSFHLLLYL